MLRDDDSAAAQFLNKTRKGGIGSPKKENSKIIVDMREFKSELPAIIHARGIEIEPLTITVSYFKIINQYYNLYNCGINKL